MKHTHKMEMKKSDLYLWKKWLPHTWLPRSHLKCWSVSLRRFIHLPLRWTAFLWISGPSRLKRNRLAYVDSVISMTSYGQGLFGPEWVGGRVQDDWKILWKLSHLLFPNFYHRQAVDNCRQRLFHFFPFQIFCCQWSAFLTERQKSVRKKKKKGRPSETATTEPKTTYQAYSLRAGKATTILKIRQTHEGLRPWCLLS